MELRIPLMRRLTEDGFRVAAVGPDPGEAFVAPEFEYHRYPLKRTLDPLADWRATGFLERLFREHRPDLVHSVDMEPSPLVPAAAARAGVPACVRTITGMGALFSSASPKALAMAWALASEASASSKRCARRRSAKAPSSTAAGT